MLPQLLTSRDKDGFTPLHTSCASRRSAVTAKLIEAGADKDALDNGGRSPVTVAVSSGDHRSAQLLLERGARSDLFALKEWPPLCVAADNGDFDMVAILLDAPQQIDIDARTPDGWNAAMIAAGKGYLEIVSSLVNRRGGRPVDVGLQLIVLTHIARRSQHEALTEILERSLHVLLESSFGSIIDGYAALGKANVVRALIQQYGLPEPAIWKKRRVSDLASFLSFYDLEPAHRDSVAKALEPLESALVGLADNRRLRSANLPFFPGHRLIAIEDKDTPGQNEEFAIEKPDGELALLNWTNEPIYQICESCEPDFSDSIIRIYARFFLDWVRGSVGRFLVREPGDPLPWIGNPTDEIRREAQGLLRPVTVLERLESHVRLNATVVFKNALFVTDIVIATREADIVIDAGEGPEHFTKGELRFTNEELRLQEQDFSIDGPPGVFG
jgi:hypothetical protein